MTDPRLMEYDTRTHERTSVLCVGEAMALISPIGSEPLARASAFEISMAGAEANVARYLVDLGGDASWLSAVGADPLGDRILDTLRDVGVEVEGVLRSAQHPTGVFFKDPNPDGSRVFYYRNGSAFSRLTTSDAIEWPIEGAKWVHLSGVTPALSSECLELTENILRRCRESSIPVSFDINYRSALWSGGTPGVELRRLSEMATVVFVGLDEAQSLWGVETAADVAEQFSGPRLVVVKDAHRSATEFIIGPAGVVATNVPARQVSEVVDPVGAGDAFAAGYLNQLLLGEPARRRLEMGHSVAAWTLSTAHDFRPGHGATIRPYN